MHYTTCFDSGYYHSYCHSNVFDKGGRLAQIENWGGVGAYHVDGRLCLLGRKWEGGHYPGVGTCLGYYGNIYIIPVTYILFFFSSFFISLYCFSFPFLPTMFHFRCIVSLFCC